MGTASYPAAATHNRPVPQHGERCYIAPFWIEVAGVTQHGLPGAKPRGGHLSNTRVRCRIVSLIRGRCLICALEPGSRRGLVQSHFSLRPLRDTRCSPIFAMGLLLGLSDQTASRRSVVRRPRKRSP